MLIDAPSPRKALAVAEKEARSTVDGQKSLGVVELGCTEQRLVHGSEIHRSQYRTREKTRKFVRRRFESGVWHAIRSTAEEVAPSERAGHEAPSDHETPSETETPDEWGLSEWCVVRSIYTTGRLGSGRHRYHHWTERFVLFNTDDLHAANEMATVESEAFASATGLRVFPLWEAYWLFSEPGHKIEVFSILRESKLRSRDFVSGVWGGESSAGRDGHG